MEKVGKASPRISGRSCLQFFKVLASRGFSLPRVEVLDLESSWEWVFALACLWKVKPYLEGFVLGVELQSSLKFSCRLSEFFSLVVFFCTSCSNTKLEALGRLGTGFEKVSWKPLCFHAL